MERFQAWFMQAESDYNSAVDLLKAGHFSQVCFMAQQVAEKSLKALAYFKNYDMVKSHSLVSILKDLKVNGRLEKIGRKLDLYYISARYPDALPDNIAPVLTFDSSQAEEALGYAAEFLKDVKAQIQK